MLKRNKLFKYFLDSYLELRKVTWPKRERLIRDTAIVIISAVAFTAIIGAIDFGLFLALEYFIQTRS
ncbi:MAG: hypothetical protein Athens101428_250 [Candidatus Berkelbacteria bacterium Athens1014_28]|uniref:Protein translocase subunit SecE n=1 Tax=Candidatus Berkelbacteria bacterium Athens1014_28 TaxID=2017145 RepID=A0A554LNU2_9BACT|nr:MAG: hypothetical protein Athens101428_250 [Candidatus Berkelbacteria bacterium Athens1014_28]